MVAWRYGIALLVFTRERSHESEFHISSLPRIILYILYISETPSETSSPKEAFPKQSLEAHTK